MLYMFEKIYIKKYIYLSWVGPETKWGGLGLPRPPCGYAPVFHPLPTAFIRLPICSNLSWATVPVAHWFSHEIILCLFLSSSVYLTSTRSIWVDSKASCCTVTESLTCWCWAVQRSAQGLPFNILPSWLQKASQDACCFMSAAQTVIYRIMAGLSPAFPQHWPSCTQPGITDLVVNILAVRQKKLVCLFLICIIMMTMMPY